VRTTSLAILLDVIGRQRPGFAAWLEHLFDHQIAASRAAYDQQLETERRYIQEQVTANRSLTDAQEKINVSRDKRIAPLTERLHKLLALRFAARMEAATACAAVGGSFDVDKPTDYCALTVRKLSMPAAAVALNIPQPVDAIAPMPAERSDAITVVIGTVMGVSLVVTSGMLQTDDVVAQWPIVLAAAAIGSAIAAVTKDTLRRRYADLAKYRFGRSPENYRSAAFAAVGCFAVCQIADMCLAQSGLLAHLTDQAAGSAAVSLAARTALPVAKEVTLLLVGLVLFFGYGAQASSEGYSAARTVELNGQATAEAERQVWEEEARQRRDPARQTALAALGQLRVLEQTIAETKEEIRAITTAADREVQALEQTKTSIPTGFDEAALTRLQLARNDYLGPLMDGVADLLRALHLTEPEPVRRWNVRWRRFRWCFLGWRIRLLKRRC